MTENSLDSLYSNPWGEEGVQLKVAPPPTVQDKPLEDNETKVQKEELKVAEALDEAQKSESSTYDTEVELPQGTGEEYKEFVDSEPLGDVIRRGTQVPSRLLDEGELFKLPALLVDLKNCTTVYQICLLGLSTFLYNPEHTSNGKSSATDIPQERRAYVYIRNSQEQLYEISYGERALLYEELPDYVKRAFGEEAEVKEVILKPDGMGFKLKKCTNSLKSVHFDLNYWF